ncbi:MAG TPA: anthranilate synthase component I family protein [Candidatus Limnocylindria bacterium]|nr:anthranilate synthase component I family protein [Candidatus Limnocylindria bacterium]
MASAVASVIRLEPIVRERMADLETPVSAFAKLRRLGGAFLLESAEGGERMGRYSFIGVAPRELIVSRDGDPLAALRRVMAGYERSGGTGLPRFSGGAVGYVGYEAARHFEHLPLAARDPHGLPDAVFGVYDTVVAFDHLRHTMLLIAHAADGDRAAAERRLDALDALLDGALALPVPQRVERTMRANMTPAAYEGLVRRARALIVEGDCIQIVLSQRFDIRPAPEPLALYRALRHVNPSPYMFLLETPEATLVGASPEPFVRVEGRTVVMHPIAGTRPRGADAAADAVNEAELRGSEKERAEHVMLVDLGRNDVGRVSKPGTVRVPELMRVDRFSHVMHLTSVVEATLRDDVDALGAFRACFPAGTVSGAPKIRAMERIAELETDRRGTYAGAVGYLGFDGSLDTCIAIRTALIAGGACRIQAGAGIVADSDPAAEEAETRAKAGALLRAIEVMAASATDAARGRGEDGTPVRS